MLYDTLKFLTEHLNQTFLAGGTPGGEDLVEWGNIAQLETLSNNNNTLENRIVLTLANLEEEKTLKNGKNITELGNIKIAHPSPIHLNLYLLFSMRFTDYDSAIKHLSSVLHFFQQRPVFTRNNTPTLPVGLDKLAFDLVTMGFEQQNHLWAVFGGKHYPSVLYRAKMIQVLELPVDEVSVIKRITSNEENVVR